MNMIMNLKKPDDAVGRKKSKQHDVLIKKQGEKILVDQTDLHG